MNDPGVAEINPKLASCFPQDNRCYYLFSPPAALLVWPLSFVSFDTAANRLWPTLCIWSLFAVSFFSSRIHRFFRQADSYTEGLIILACLVFFYRGRTHLPDGNITPIISALITLAAYSIMRGRLLAFSCCLIPMVLFKTLGLTWLPLLLFRKKDWRAFLYLAVITLVLNGIVLLLGGMAVYQHFFALAPQIATPAGVGIVASLRTEFGFYPKTLFLLLNLVGLAVLYYGYWKKRNQQSSPAENTLSLVAVLAGAIALYCLFNFSVTLPYCPNYLFFPFFGWILQEGYLAAGIWRRVILVGVVFSFLVISSEWIIKSGLFHLLGATSVAWYHSLIFQPCFILIIPAFFLAVALRRLLSKSL
jgi:hypothetical protein